MQYDFTNGTAEQRRLWKHPIASLLNLPADLIPLTAEVSFVPPDEVSDQTAFASTTWTPQSKSGTQRVRNDAPGFGDLDAGLIAEATSQGLHYDPILHFHETSSHELGHAVFGSLPHEVRVEIARMFGCKTDDEDELNPQDVDWEDRPVEGIAETFKEAFLPARFRVFPNRTQCKISYSKFPRFRHLIREGLERVSGEGLDLPGYNFNVYRRDRFSPDWVPLSSFELHGHETTPTGGTFVSASTPDGSEDIGGAAWVPESDDASDPGQGLWGPWRHDAPHFYPFIRTFGGWEVYLAGSDTGLMYLSRGTDFHWRGRLPAGAARYAPSAEMVAAYEEFSPITAGFSHEGQAVLNDLDLPAYFYPSYPPKASEGGGGETDYVQGADAFGNLMDGQNGTVAGGSAANVLFMYWDGATWVVWEKISVGRYGSVVNPLGEGFVVVRLNVGVGVEAIAEYTASTQVPEDAPLFDTCGGKCAAVRVMSNVVFKSPTGAGLSDDEIRAAYLPTTQLSRPSRPCKGDPIPTPPGSIAGSGGASGARPHRRPTSGNRA